MREATLRETMATVEFVAANLPLVLTLLGGALIIAEAFAPGANFFPVGVGLFAAGLVGFLLPPFLGPFAWLIMAGVVVLATGGTLWAYWESDLMTGGGKDRTSDSESLRGQLGHVTERVTPRTGEVKLDDGGFTPYYQARSVDGEIPEGEEIIVLDPGGGNVLTVESVSDARDDIDRELARAREDDTATGTSGTTGSGGGSASADAESNREAEPESSD
jgi:membrane protein implicated in regulation of membrane protease activity